MLPQTQNYEPRSVQIEQDKLYVQANNGGRLVFSCTGENNLECILEDDMTTDNPRIPELVRVNGNTATLYAPTTSYSLTLRQ